MHHVCCITPPPLEISRCPSLFVPPLSARSVRALATLCPVSLLGGESRRTPSYSRRTAAGSNPSRALATTKTRLRRWAKPKYWASRTRHATVLWGPCTTPASVHLPPGGTSGSSSPASPARKQPKALSLVESTPGTFSQKTMDAAIPALRRTESIASAISQKMSDRFPRASLRDRRRPATLNAWQGVPPQNTSGASTSPKRMRVGKVVMSPRFGTSG